MARRPPPPPKSTGLPPAFFGIVVLLVAVVAVFYIGSKVGPPEEEAPPVEKKSPFADIPDELPPGVTKRESPFASTSSDGEPGSDAEKPNNPFADLATPKSDPIWTDAMELGDAGMDLAEQAAKAKQAGDHDGFKSFGKQAKEKLNEALTMTAEWEQGLVADLGASHGQVRSIQRTRKIWLNRLMALKKTVGM